MLRCCCDWLDAWPAPDTLSIRNFQQLSEGGDADNLLARSGGFQGDHRPFGCCAAIGRGLAGGPKFWRLRSKKATPFFRCPHVKDSYPERLTNSQGRTPAKCT